MSVAGKSFKLNLLKSILPITVYRDVVFHVVNEEERRCERVITIGQLELNPTLHNWHLIRTFSTYDIDSALDSGYGHMISDYYRILTRNSGILIDNCCHVCFHSKYKPDKEYAKNLWNAYAVEIVHVVVHSVVDAIQIREFIDARFRTCDYCLYRPLFNVYLPEFCQYDNCNHGFGSRLTTIRGSSVDLDIWQDIKAVLSV